MASNATAGPPEGIRAAIYDSQGARKVTGKPGTSRKQETASGTARAAANRWQRPRWDRYALAVCQWTSPAVREETLRILYRLTRYSLGRCQSERDKEHNTGRPARTEAEQKRFDNADRRIGRVIDVWHESIHGKPIPSEKQVPKALHNGKPIDKLPRRDVAVLLKRDRPTFVRILVGQGHRSGSLALLNRVTMPKLLQFDRP